MTDVEQVATTVVRTGVEPAGVAAVEHRRAGGATGTVGVVVVHGAGGDLDDPVLVALADTVAATGAVAVRANLGYRQRRPSGPPPRAEASVADLAATLVAVARDHPDRRWVLGGKSYGGRVATMAVAQGAIPSPVEVAGLVCCSYPLHPPGRPDRLRVAHLRDLDVPLLVVQGTADPFGTPAELAPHLADVARATVIAVEGGGHGLHVPRTRSADGATHHAPTVVAGLSGELAAWLGSLR